MTASNGFMAKFKKVGGRDLLRQYWGAGVLFYAIAQLALLGTSQKSLELLRLGVQNKINRKLRKKYARILQEYGEQGKAREAVPDAAPAPVWICWWQGMDCAPDIVRACFKSVQTHCQGRPIHVVTQDNYGAYVDFPAHIIEKWNAGVITHTHMSDLLRVELLIRHGGIWLDATVLLTAPIPQNILDCGYFCFRTLKPASNGQALEISSWFMAAKPNQALLLLVRKLLYAYWEENRRLIDYFLLHHFISIAKDYCPSAWEGMPLYNNSDPHILLLQFFDLYEENTFRHICGRSAVHKLSCKFDAGQFEKPGTYFQHVLDKSH